MNNQDKQEFEKWFKDFYQVDFNPGEPRFMNQSIAWKYACEYMRNKSNPLDALSLYEKLETERAENKKLREALEMVVDNTKMPLEEIE
jgi:hypothetical protein